MFGVVSLDHLIRIPPFGLWGGTGGHLGNRHRQQKRGGNFLVSLPLLICFYGLHFTYVFPYQQTGEYPQYANSGNQGY